jgi:cell division protein FtsZ
MAKSSFITSPAKIKVVGVGGGGCNVISRMVKEEIQGVEFYALNTDSQSLSFTEAPNRIQVGERVTRGLGCGGDHNVGAKAAEESYDGLRQALAGADMVFITAGMGGGTGTGGAPIVAEIAKKNGALTIAVVTKPFTFEGGHRSKVAEEGIANLIPRVDTLIIVPNDRLIEMVDATTAVGSAFKMADDVLTHAVQAIAEVITVPGMINLDFADVRAVMKDAGPAWMSIGRGSGQNRAREAAQAALASPMLDVSIKGAKGVLFNVTGGQNLTLHEVRAAADLVQQAVDPDATIIFGVVYDPKMENDCKITLIATGFVSSATGGPPTKAELLRLVKDKEDGLDVPAIFRNRSTHGRPMIMARPAPQETKAGSKSW